MVKNYNDTDPAFQAMCTQGELLTTATTIPDWKTHTAKGAYKNSNGVYDLLLDTENTHDTPAPGTHRYDIIQLKNDGTLSIKKGTADIIANIVTAPTPDANNILVTTVYVNRTTGRIRTVDITDNIDRGEGAYNWVTLADGTMEKVYRAGIGPRG